MQNVGVQSPLGSQQDVPAGPPAMLVPSPATLLQAVALHLQQHQNQAGIIPAAAIAGGAIAAEGLVALPAAGAAAAAAAAAAAPAVLQ